jgi:hypothetical protein
MDWRSGSATGVAVVMRYDPANDEYVGGVNSHNVLPSFASMARVFPYVVVTKTASCVAPLTRTP